MLKNNFKHLDQRLFLNDINLHLVITVVNSVGNMALVKSTNKKKRVIITFMTLVLSILADNTESQFMNVRGEGG